MVANRTHVAAAARTASTNDELMGELTIFSGVNVERSRLETIMAVMLPTPLRNPPQRRGERPVNPPGPK